MAYFCPVTFKVKSRTVLKHIKYAKVYLSVDVFLIIVFVVLYVMFRDNKYYQSYYDHHNYSSDRSNSE